METIVNKVAESGIVTLDLAPYIPDLNNFKSFDLKPFLFRELILKEKDFRASLVEYDWSQFENKFVAITCTADAIIPVWAYMLVASYLQPIAASVDFGSIEDTFNAKVREAISAIDITEFSGKRVVVKGCGTIAIPDVAYVLMTAKLRPVVKSVMYGEPCSTVPIYKAPKTS